MVYRPATLNATFCFMVLTSHVLSLEAAGADYQRDVKGVFSERCFACHGALKQEADLRLDTVQLMLDGGSSGPVIVPGNAQESLLVTRISAAEESERMPPEGHPLTAQQIASVVRWINRGAVHPVDEVPEQSPAAHWAFQKPLRGKVPEGKGIPPHPIDAILDTLRNREDLRTVVEAERSLLLRRLYLDIIGLPPTREQLHVFLADQSANAWERAVDELLDSPQYGERWGRHWMDVWRYTDWYGLGTQVRNSQKHIWHWRDWIVESLNDDKGYDQMVLEMLAGDEIAPADPDILRATGYLVRNYYLFNRTTWLDQTIEHTSKAFLGLTINCSKCHDHKYDPITQHDYYRFRAIFEPYQVRLDTVPGELNLENDGLPRVFDAHPDTPTYLHVRGNEKDPDDSRVIAPGPPEVLRKSPFSVEVVKLPYQVHSPQFRDFVLDDHLRNTESLIGELEKKRTVLERQFAALKGHRQVDLAGPLFLEDSFDSPQPKQWIQGEGNWKYGNGLLHQSLSGASRKQFISVHDHPRDFVATLRFRLLGGDKWKSVGLIFDVAGGREKTVYMSGVSGASKLQVSHSSDGKSTYPAAGRVSRPVATGEWYELRVAVKDKLVNIAINSEEILAYQFSIKRENGKIGFIAFDAQVEFDSIKVSVLGEHQSLYEPGGDKPLSQETSPMQLDHLRHQIVAETAKLAMFKSAFVAGRNEADPAIDSQSSLVQELVRKAAVATREHARAVSEAAVTEAILKVALAKEEKAKDAATKSLGLAREALVKAMVAVKNPGTDYYRFVASIKALEGPAETSKSQKTAYSDFSTGRRTALAKWLISKDNPLTARVAVNHIWARHFGQPLVDPMVDFGRRTPLPRQHMLLDWLAVEMLENQWSMKHMHRVMVTSSAYRLSCSARGHSIDLLTDPNNELYWRRTSTRMESQVVRDSLLSLADALDGKMGGPSVSPKNAAGRRRSLYFTHSRDNRSSFLSMFDDADILRCYRRQESIVPHQALAMANSKLSLEMARILAGQLHNEIYKGAATTGALDVEFVEAAFESVLSRLPSAAETTACQQAMLQVKQLNAGRQDASLKAASAVVHSLFNHNDFVTIR